MKRRTTTALRVIALLAGLYGLACLLGFLLLVLAFKLGLLRGLDILFYRGLILISLVFPVVFGLLALGIGRLAPRDLSLRDAFSASVLSLSLNICFLVVVPVTVDRSISIFVLGRMAANPDAIVTPEAMTAQFTDIYVARYHQIERRLREQAVSGNVERVGDGYRITRAGRGVIAVSKVVAALFDSHVGLVAPGAPPAR